MAKCRYCGKEFEPKSSKHFFCGRECRVSFYREKLNHDIADRRRAWRESLPEYSFVCVKCGAVVEIKHGEKYDKRRRFCSKLCYRRYWRHMERKNPTRLTNIYASQINRDVNKYDR